MRDSLELELARRIGHPPAFTDEELRQIDLLSVLDGRGSFEQLEACVGLGVVNLGGCEITDFSWWPRAMGCSSVDLYYSPAEFLPPLAERSPKVRRLDISVSMFRDLTPLRGLTDRFIWDVQGLPMTEESYRDLVPELKATTRRLKVSDEDSWKAAVAIADKFRATYAYGKVFFPGLLYTDNPDLSGIPIGFDDLYRILDDDSIADTAAFQARCQEHYDRLKGRI